jgi:hypothetical protein
MRSIQHVAEICLDYISTADVVAALGSTTPGQRRSLISHITAALQVCYSRAPEAFAGQVGAGVIAPVTCTITATNGSQVITISGYTPDPRGRTFMVGGQYYQIAVTGPTTIELVEPWRGTSGAMAATIYCDAIEIASSFHHLLGDVLAGGVPLFAAPDRASFLNLRDNSQTGDYGQMGVTIRNARRPGTPESYWVEESYLSTGVSKRFIRLAPFPSTSFGLSYTVGYRPREISVADLSDATLALPLPGDFVDSIFVPIVLQRWTGSPWFRNESAKTEIARQFKEATALLDNWSAQDSREIRIHVSAY